jgi:hypothetical protein
MKFEGKKPLVMLKRTGKDNIKKKSLKESVGTARTGLIWLRIVTSCPHL